MLQINLQMRNKIATIAAIATKTIAKCGEDDQSSGAVNVANNLNQGNQGKCQGTALRTNAPQVKLKSKHLFSYKSCSKSK